MLGAICGDIIGSRFERYNIRRKDFDLFTDFSRFTDDTVMTCAVAAALLNHLHNHTDLSQDAVRYMQSYGRAFPHRGYGGNFSQWIKSPDPKPYNSFGNGAAMRVSPCGFLAKTLEEAQEYARQVTKVSHNHPEGMRGAESIASAVFLAKTGASKQEISKYINEHYYTIDFTLDDIRYTYEFDVSCQGSVPQALEAFFESKNFEDAIRNAISIGGDSDTIGAITGSVAEAYYGVPPELAEKVVNAYLNDFLQKLVTEYYRVVREPSSIINDSKPQI